MALITALTVGEGAVVGGAAAERTPKYLPWARWGQEHRSGATAEKHCLGLRVRGGAACVEGC